MATSERALSQPHQHQSREAPVNMGFDAPNYFSDLLQNKGEALTRKDIEDFAATEQRNANWNRGIAATAFGLFLASVFANHYLGWQSGTRVFLHVLIIVLAVILIAAALLFFFMAKSGAQEVARAIGAIRRDVEKDAAVARAIRLSDEEPGIVLFLRSFQVEAAGHSTEEFEKYLESEAKLAVISQLHSEEFAHPVPKLLPEKNIWSMEAVAIAAVQAHLPTVLLDNVSLSDEKRAELNQAQPIVIPVLGEWWPEFIRWTEKARLIIIFLQSATVSLSREIEFVIKRQKPCVLICSEELRDRLLQSEDQLLRRLMKHAADTVTYRDFNAEGDLRKSLDAALARLIEH